MKSPAEKREKRKPHAGDYNAGGHAELHCFSSQRQIPLKTVKKESTPLPLFTQNASSFTSYFLSKSASSTNSKAENMILPKILNIIKTCISPTQVGECSAGT